MGEKRYFYFKNLDIQWNFTFIVYSLFTLVLKIHFLYILFHNYLPTYESLLHPEVNKLKSQ